MKLPKYFRKNTSIKSIDVTCLEWFDRTYGNSYFSASIVVNFGLKNEFTFKLPFQYGHGDHYLDMVAKEMVRMGAVDKEFFHYGRVEKKFQLRASKTEGCLKKQVVCFGGN